jgi:hypothetical protein
VVRQVVHHPGAVVIMPQFEAGRLLLIAQYRFAMGGTLLEFPAGPPSRAKPRWNVPGANRSKRRGTGRTTGIR